MIPQRTKRRKLKHTTIKKITKEDDKRRKEQKKKTSENKVMTIASPHLLIITLNINELNSLVKSYKVAE